MAIVQKKIKSRVNGDVNVNYHGGDLSVTQHIQVKLRKLEYCVKAQSGTELALTKRHQTLQMFSLSTTHMATNCCNIQLSHIIPNVFETHFWFIF